MITIRPAAARGRTRIAWLDSAHTFSFGEYQDPQHMGWSVLRVINEDTVVPGGGFATHGHRDMEIVTWVLEGALEHKDSLGNGSVIRPGDVQRMSAGTGIRHSEFNHSKTASVHFLQIWILPSQGGIEPGYEQRAIAMPEGAATLIASSDGREGSITIHQDASVHVARLAAGQSLRHALRPGRKGWVQLARGALTVNGIAMKAGDGMALGGEAALAIEASASSEALLFDLP